MANCIRSKQFLQTYKTNKSKGFTLIELAITTVASLAVISVTLFIVNNQREEVLANQNRAQGSQNLRASLDLMGTDVQLAGERLHSSTDLPVIQLLDGDGSNSTDGYDQLVIQRRLIEASLQTCEVLDDTETEIVVADSTAPPACGALSDIGPDTDGNQSTANPNTLSDLLDEFKEYRCEDAAASECDRTDLFPTSAADCVSFGEVSRGCVVAYIVDPTIGFGEFFYYTNEYCFGDCADHLNGNASANIKNIISAIPLEAVDGTGGTNDWNHPHGSYPPGSRIYILEERHYRFNPPDNDDESGILEMVLNNEDDYAELSAGPNGGEALRLVNQIEALSIEIEIPGVNGGLQTVTEYNTAPNLAVGQPLYDRWAIRDAGGEPHPRSVRGIMLHIEAARPSESDAITLPKGGCNFAPFNQKSPYNASPSKYSGPEEVPGLCISSKYIPRNAFSTDL